MDAKLHEDIGALKEGMEWLKTEVHEIRTDVKSLTTWKWKLAGGSAVVAALIAAGIQLAPLFLQ